MPHREFPTRYATAVIKVSQHRGEADSPAQRLIIIIRGGGRQAVKRGPSFSQIWSGNLRRGKPPAPLASHTLSPADCRENSALLIIVCPENGFHPAIRRYSVGEGAASSYPSAEWGLRTVQVVPEVAGAGN